MIQIEGDSLPPESRGAVIPCIWGDAVLEVPSTPTQIPFTAQLADNCGAHETDVLLKISAADIAETVRRLTPRLPVVAAIEQEWVRVNAFVTSPGMVQMSVSRHFGGTIAAEHKKGSTVTFLETRELHIFCWNPPGLRYPDDAVLQLRIDNVAQTPPSTIRIQDDRLVVGERFLTVEFDESRTFGAITPAPVRSTTVTSITQAAPPSFGARALPAPSNILRESTTSTGVGQLAGLQTIELAPQPVRPPPPPPLPMPLPRTSAVGTSGFSATGITVGRLTADIKGLLDTPAGRYSGTGSAPLLEPAPITAARLEVLYGETALDPASFAETRAKHAEWGLRWRILDYGEDFETFRTQTGFCGFADLWLDDTGIWHYTVQDANRAVVTTLTPREIIGEPALAFIAPSATQLQTAWGAGLQRGTFMIPAEGVVDDMIARYGIITDRKLSLPYVADERAARTLTLRWKRRWDRPHASASIAVAPGLAALTRTDKVYVDTALLALYGTRRVPWEIRATTDRGDQRKLVLVEGDAASVDLALTFAISGIATTYGLPLTFEIARSLLTLALTFTVTSEGPTLTRTLTFHIGAGGEYFSGDYFGRYFSNGYFG